MHYQEDKYGIEIAVWNTGPEIRDFVGRID